MSNAMYYIAIIAPSSVNERVLEWKHWMRDRFGCIVALKSPAHITVISPFWMKTDLEPTLKNLIDDFRVSQKGFPINLRDFNCFKPRVIFVDIEKSDSLDSLQAEFQKHLNTTNLVPLKKEISPFHPHITIANRDLLKKDFTEAWQYFQTKRYKASFVADSISLLKHNGIIWEPIYNASFPFT